MLSALEKFRLLLKMLSALEKCCLLLKMSSALKKCCLLEKNVVCFKEILLAWKKNDGTPDGRENIYFEEKNIQKQIMKAHIKSTQAK